MYFDPNLGVKGRIAAFDKANGGDCILIDGWFVYSNGAMRERNPLGALIDAPSDPLQRAKFKVRYEEVLLAQAVQEFESRRTLLIDSAKNNLQSPYACPPPCSVEQATSELKQLQAAVNKQRRRLEAAQDALNELSPVEDLARATVLSETRASNDAFISAVKAIRV